MTFCEVIKLYDNYENEELVLEAAPVDNYEPELMLMTNIATPVTADSTPVESVDMDFETERMENMNQNDTDFNKMARTKYEAGTGNEIESQALKDKTKNNIVKDRNYYGNGYFCHQEQPSSIHIKLLLFIVWQKRP
ncbi:hypothetical protein BDD12DRAFT_810285 [Trichophaea hybrida]|nr:hypothetical protein BDD12DRAFT_810285 [Trichophaea hybrida]